jgi:site-specific DNA recombinase
MVAPVEMRSLIREIIEQITVAADRIEIRLNRAKIAAALQAGVRSEPDLDLVILSIEAKLRRAGKGKRLVIVNGAEAEVNEGLVDLIKEAFAIRNQLLSGSDASIETMSGRIGMNKGRLPRRNICTALPGAASFAMAMNSSNEVIFVLCQRLWLELMHSSER